MIEMLDRLDGVRETGPERWIAKCPAHEDRSPSLSIRDVGDRLLIHCFAGCDALDVVHSLGLELADLFADRPEHHSKPTHRRIPLVDTLKTLSHEVLVVGTIASDMLEHREIDDEDFARLATAARRIGSARDMYR